MPVCSRLQFRHFANTVRSQNLSLNFAASLTKFEEKSLNYCHESDSHLFANSSEKCSVKTSVLLTTVLRHRQKHCKAEEFRFKPRCLDVRRKTTLIRLFNIEAERHKIIINRAKFCRLRCRRFRLPDGEKKFE